LPISRGNATPASAAEGIPLTLAAGYLGVKLEWHWRVWEYGLKLASAPRHTVGIAGQPVVVQNHQHRDACAQDVLD